MDIRILQLTEGAAQAEGTAVVIDVFRAFSLECYLASWGAAEIRPVGEIEEAFDRKRSDPAVVLIGERGGAKYPGFDYGNSPCSIPPDAVRGRRVIHTTSAGTQGITHAVHAQDIITGSLVNAKAVADYLLAGNPEIVSLVAMGKAGKEPCEEDLLCAEYIRSMLLGRPMADIDERIRELRFHGGEHFFNPATQEIYPRDDFGLCVMRDRFPFVLRVTRDESGILMEKMMV